MASKCKSSNVDNLDKLKRNCKVPPLSEMVKKIQLRYFERKILERHWRYTLQEKPPRRCKTPHPSTPLATHSIPTSH
jgi:hypothetical protein